MKTPFSICKCSLCIINWWSENFELHNRLVILKSKSFLNVAYRYFQCRMMLLMRINKNFSSKLIPRVSVFSLVVLLKVE